jgi:hypothetical protein
MSSTLKRILYSLVVLDISIKEAVIPSSDLLATARYSCVYWVDHLYDSEPRSWADGVDDLKATRLRLAVGAGACLALAVGTTGLTSSAQGRLAADRQAE